MGTLKPTLRLRKLGLALRHHREAAGLTLDDAAALLNRHPSSISRIEKGLHHVPVRDVEYYLIKYGVTDPAEYTRLYDLSRNARKKGWWHQYKGDLSHETMDLISLESDAASIEYFELVLIPGLLQNEAYARALIRRGPFASDSERVKRLVAIRMRRQEILTRPNPPRLHAIIDEAAIHRQVGGPDVMKSQLQRLLSLSQLPNVSLQVLPFTLGAYKGMTGAFIMLTMGKPSNLRLAAVDSLTEMSYREHEHELSTYQTAFDHLAKTALPATDSWMLIKRVLSQS